MLVRLNAIPGVAEASVDAGGKRFLLALHPGADRTDIISRSLAVLGLNSRLIEDPGMRMEEAADELWLKSSNIRLLSRLEAQLLAERWGNAAAAAGRLDSDTALVLSELLRVEIVREFDAVHGKGGTDERGWYVRAFPAAFDRALLRLSPITPEQMKAVKDSLIKSLGA